MANSADLVIVGISVGVALGILIAALAFFGIWWYRKRYHNQQHINQRSVASSQRQINGSNSSVDSNTSFSHSVDIDGIATEPASCQPSWWARQRKDQIISTSGIPRYSYKCVFYVGLSFEFHSVCLAYQDIYENTISLLIAHHIIF